MTPQRLTNAVRQLSRSDKGRDALRAMLNWMNDTGLSLDQENQLAVITLLWGAWGSYPGTTRELMTEALERETV
jgi:hypothetical protein